MTTTLDRPYYERVWRYLRGWLKREPHFIIGSPDNPYLRRWYVIPRNHYCNIYLHQFLRSDDDRALHDHPWRSVSFVLRGRYIDHTAERSWLFRAGSIVRRTAVNAHRVELINGAPAWTLFITGPVRREWGFHCPKGWVPWQEFVAHTPGGNTLGRGCE